MNELIKNHRLNDGTMGHKYKPDCDKMVNIYPTCEIRLSLYYTQR